MSGVRFSDHRAASAQAGAAVAFDRLIGRAGSPEQGDTLIVVAGIHGNEPAGVIAAQRVYSVLASRDLDLKGELVLLAGNTRALAQRQRFLERDLNRGWTTARLDRLRHQPIDPELHPEDSEQLELLEQIEPVLARARGKVYFLDLHTTSSDGYPFGMILDGAPQRLFAYHFPVPILLGILDQIDSVLLRYMHARGCVSVGIEGGQNETPHSIDHHVAILWLGLTAAGLLPLHQVPDTGLHRALLTRATYGCPRILQVVHRHAIRPEDEFKMLPGFANIQRVKRGELLAHDRYGEIRAREDGVICLPLYQAQGDDGFFFGRELQP